MEMLFLTLICPFFRPLLLRMHGFEQVSLLTGGQRCHQSETLRYVNDLRSNKVLKRDTAVLIIIVGDSCCWH